MSEYVRMHPDGNHSLIRCPDLACDTQVARFEDWLAHVRTHVMDGRDSTACPWMGCDRIYQRRHKLYEHVKSHIGFNDRICLHLTDSRPENRVRCTYSTCYSHSLGIHRSTVHGYDKDFRTSVDPYVDDLSQDLENVVLSGGNIERARNPAGGDRRYDGDGGNPHFQPEDIKAEPEDLDVPEPGIGVEGDGAPVAAMPMNGPGIPGPAGPMHNMFGQNLPDENANPWIPYLPQRGQIYRVRRRSIITYTPRVFWQLEFIAQDFGMYRRIVRNIEHREVVYEIAPVIF
ncbi:unnamed protein product [Somion occarium]|uniref:C2H2-type domain-containing protein n=1 Tax=Somion occarium TaxID=3059160 RepID=A0ABP1DPP5_9APHY